MAKERVLKAVIAGDAQGVSDAVGKTEGKFSKLAKAGKALAIGVGAAGAAIGAAAFKVAALGDDIAKSAQKAGLAVEPYQELKFAFGQGGVEAGQFDNAVQKFNKRIGEAADGTGSATDAVETLGLKLEDANGKMRNTDAVLHDALRGLAAMDEDARRAAVAGDLFGQRAGPELAAALSDGMEGIDDAVTKARELGIVMDEESTKAAERFTDAWDDLKSGSLAFLRDAAVPVMTFLGDKVFPFLTQTLVPALRDVKEAFGEDGIAGAFSELKGTFEEVGPKILDTVRNIVGSIFDWVSENVPKIADFILDQRERFFDAALGIFSSLVEALPEIIPKVVSGLVSLITKLVETIVQALPLVLDGAVKLFLGLVEGLISVLPDLLDGVLEVITSVLDALLDALPKLVDAGVELLLALLEGLVEVLPQLVEFIANDLIPKLIETTVKMLPQLVEAGVKILVAVLHGLIRVLPQIIKFIVVDLIPQLVAALIRSIPQLQDAGFQILGGMLSGIMDKVPSITGFVGRIPSFLVSALGNLGRILYNAGLKILGGLWDGLKSKWRSVAGWLGGLGGAIARLKGPVEEDAKLLTNEGEAIIGGLMEGMKQQIPALERLVGGIAPDLPDMFAHGGDGSALVPPPAAESQVIRERMPGESRDAGIIGLLEELVEAVRENQTMEVDGEKITAVVRRRSEFAGRADT